MTRLGFISDVHVGNHKQHGGPVVAGLNNRCRQTIDVLKSAVTKAVELKCSELFILGDLFDTARPEPQAIAAVQEALTQPQLGVTILLGNHDMVSTAYGDHALGPLAGYGLIEVVETPKVYEVGDVEVILVPFRPGPAKVWLPDALREIENQRRIGPFRVLAIHLGISDDTTPPWLKDADDSISLTQLTELCDMYGISQVFAGNWHDRRLWEDDGDICQVGALVPTGWDNPGLTGRYGTLAVLDDKNPNELIELPGPRFVKAHDRGQADQAYLGAKCHGHTLYLRCIGFDRDDKSVLDTACAAVEYLPDEVEVQTAARLAAEAAKSSTTLAESLDGFIAEMPIKEPATRQGVLERSRRLLKV